MAMIAIRSCLCNLRLIVLLIPRWAGAWCSPTAMTCHLRKRRAATTRRSRSAAHRRPRQRTGVPYRPDIGDGKLRRYTRRHTRLTCSQRGPRARRASHPPLPADRRLTDAIPWSVQFRMQLDACVGGSTSTTPAWPTTSARWETTGRQPARMHAPARVGRGPWSPDITRLMRKASPNQIAARSATTTATSSTWRTAS